MNQFTESHLKSWKSDYILLTQNNRTPINKEHTWMLGNKSYFYGSGDGWKPWVLVLFSGLNTSWSWIKQASTSCCWIFTV